MVNLRVIQELVTCKVSIFKASSAKELQNVRSLISITHVYNKHINSASEKKEKFKVGIIVFVG